MEPNVFGEVETEMQKLGDQFTTPNVVKYIILNVEAYKELVDYEGEYPDTILGHPIVLDVDSSYRVKVLSNCYTEFCLRNK